MSGRVLLDTNIVIALFAGDEAVQAAIDGAGEVLLSSVVVGELSYGAHCSARVDENLARIHELAASVPVLGCDGDTGQHYGRIKAELRRKGQPIPENDIWIAALAAQHDASVATRDEHFANIDAIRCVRW